ncbi:MAG TPA: hypothetical protein VNO30_05860 [Kofleriaceae bacterium]|nr:hypothetical protein [Kofleriaceae bacterium]
MSILRFVSRRPLLCLGALAGLWWLWPDAAERPRPAAAPAVQAAVLADGFAAIDGGRRVATWDDDAHRRHELAVTGAPAGARVIGLGGRVGLVWRDGRRIAVGLVEDGGGVEHVQRFGSRVAAMCLGVATNEHRAGVAWFEATGSVWFVGGPTSRRSAAAMLAVPGFDPAKADVCAIASAGEQVALLWTEGSRTSIALCGRQCGTPRRIELPKKTAVIGLGCAPGGCVVATRGEGGATQATWIGSNGLARWTQPLPHARPGTPLSITGAGRRIAIAYATANEPVVVTLAAPGELATVWQGASDGVPSVVAAGDRLLVARSVDGALTASLVRAP